MEHSGNTSRVAGHDLALRRSAIATCIALALLAGPGHAQKVTCSPGADPNEIGPDGVVCGAKAFSSGDGAMAFGYEAKAVGGRAIAIGRRAAVSAIDGLALGAGATVDAGAVGSVALGAGSRATGTSLATPAYLTGTTATSELAIGGRRITGVADGANNDDAATVGQLKAANVGNDLAVRYSWNDANGNKIVDAGEIDYSRVVMGADPKTGTPIAGGVEISNVQAGDVIAGGMEAVNGGQLHAISKSVVGALGGSSTMDANGVVTAGLTVDGELHTTVAGALDAVNLTAKKGWNVSADSGSSANIGPGGNVAFHSTDSNLSVAQSGNANAGKVDFTLSRNLTLDSATMGGTVVNATGLTLTGGPSVTTAGIDAGSKKITNVAIGAVSAGSADAVNGSQLAAVDKTANAGWNATDAAGNKANIGPNGNVTFQSADTNLSVIQKGSDDAGVVEVELAKNLDLGTSGGVTMGSTLVNATGLAIAGGPSVTTAGINAGSKKITNVAIGEVSDTSTDAVNGSQLAAVKDSVNAGWNLSAQGDAATRTKVASGETVDLRNADGNVVISKTAASDDVTFDLARDIAVDSVTMGGTVVDATGLTIANGPSITVNGIDAGGKAITNVAAGSLTDTSTDAVNGSQLFATNKAIEDLGSVAGNANDLAVKYAWTDANGDGIATSDEIDYGTVALAGPSGAGTRINNVAPGLLDPGSMQAVNGSQLFQSMSQVATMLGGGSTMTSQGLLAPSYFIQNATYNDVGSALHALDVAVTRIDGRPVVGGSNLVGYTHDEEGGHTPYGNGGSSSTALGVNAHAAGVEDAVAVGESARVGAEYGTALGQNASATAESAVALGHDSVADRANTVSVGSAGNERQVVNVADATQGTDAINKRQLDRGVVSANSYTDARVTALSDSFEMFQGNVDQRLRKQDRRIDRQGAMSAAMMNMAVSAAGIHTPNRVGVGVGFQGGESALSLGYQRAFSDRATLTFGGAFSSDDQAVGIGAGFGW